MTGGRLRNRPGTPVRPPRKPFFRRLHRGRVRLTVLGNTGRYLAPLAGGSGYLVEAEGARVLLDCGGGVREACARLGVERLDMVVLSHFHFDHVQDFVTLRAALDAGTTVVLPPGEARRLDALAQAYVFDGPFDLPGPLVEAREGEALRAGPLRLTFAPTQHSAPSFATRIDGPEGSLVYASDTAPCEGLRRLARGCDLLLMHALIPRVEPHAEHARIHSTAETAAALAAEAGAKRLLLSHRWHGSHDADMLAAALPHFAGVELARDGMATRLRRSGA